MKAINVNSIFKRSVTMNSNKPLIFRRIITGILSLSLVASPMAALGVESNPLGWEPKDVATIAEKLSKLPDTRCKTLNLLRDMANSGNGMPLDEALKILVGKDEGCRIAARNEVARFVFEYSPDYTYEDQVEFYYTKMDAIIQFEQKLQEKFKYFSEQQKGPKTRSTVKQNKKHLETVTEQLGHLHDAIFYLQDYWVALNADYMMNENTSKPEIKFAAGFSLGATAVIGTFVLWSAARGRKILTKNSGTSGIAKDIATRGIRSFGKMFFRSSGRSAFRSSLRVGARSLVRAGGRRLVLGIGARQTVRTSAIMGANSAKGKSVDQSNAPALPQKTRSLLVITSEEEFYHSPFEMFAINDAEIKTGNQEEAIRSITSFVDHEDEKFYMGLLGSIFGGLIAAEATEQWVAKKAANTLFKVPGYAFLKRAGLEAGEQSVRHVALLPSLGFIERVIQSSAISRSTALAIGTWLVKAGQVTSKYSRVGGGIVGFLAGVAVGWALDSWIQDYLDSKELEEIKEQVAAYYRLAKNPDNSPYEAKMYVSRLTSALVQWAGFYTYPLVGTQEFLARELIHKQVCTAYYTPVHERHYTWKMMKNWRVQHIYDDMNNIPRKFTRFNSEAMANVSTQRYSRFSEAIEKTVRSFTDPVVNVKKVLGEFVKELETFNVATIEEEIQQLYMFQDTIDSALNPNLILKETRNMSEEVREDLFALRKSGDLKGHKKFQERGYECLQPYSDYDFNRDRAAFDQKIEKDIRAWTGGKE